MTTLIAKALIIEAEKGEKEADIYFDAQVKLRIECKNRR